MIARKYYYTFHKTGDAYAISLTPKVIIGLLQVLIILFVIVILIFYWRQLYNFLIYNNKKFTEDSKLIDFTENICPNFQNAYSINYTQDDDFLKQEEPQSELEEAKYKHLVSKEILIKKVSWLFDQYQQDRMARNFELIKEYTLEPFKSKYKYISSQNSDINLNIRYKCKLSKIIPLNFEIREELRRFIIQINGEMISFKVSQKGYVLSGKSQLRYFTEYWDIALNADNKSYIVTIYKI